MGWGSKSLRGLVEVGELDSLSGRVLLEERFRALQRLIPLLYTIALTNFLGLYLATGGVLDSLASPGMVLVGLVLIRLVHWLKVRGQKVPAEKVVRELRKTWVYALVVSLGFSCWGLYLLGEARWDHQNHVILFGSLASIGCAYGLSSFPSAARLPLLFLGLPLAIRLIISDDIAHVGMGVSLAAIILLNLRLLHIHDKGFAQLVQSRCDIAAERERARRAERAAKAEKAKARTIADTDPLTGLANRRAFLRALTRRAAAARRGEGSFTLAMADLDGFKPINDLFGHAAGDSVLQQVGARLVALSQGALVARTGGDEFALLLPDAAGPGSARAAGAAVCAALQEPFLVDGREFRISACCGLALLTPEDCDVTQALIHADTALYRAKQNGRAGVALFSAEMDEVNRRRLQIERALREPDSHDRIHVVFQPIVDLMSGGLRAFEALARWSHPTLGEISPAEFIPVAERINVIEALSDALLAKAASEAADWAQPVRLSFNVSAVQLCAIGAAQRLLGIIDRAGLPPERLQVEVTETALLADFAGARVNLDALRAAGARIVLDDFGAGHASISYLREMRFDGVKLDGSLIASVTGSLQARRLLKGVLDLCASLRLPCVAEHVETEEQRALLRGLGCRDGQGYLLGAPMAPAEAAALGSGKLIRLPGRSAA
jgi:diguanylate cyclase (GGDEF)-like protein